MDGFDEVIKEFLVESYECLDQLDSDLVALEDQPDDLDRLGSIFRTIHTIKGTSGFLALPKLERVAHVGENLLVPLRDGDMKLNADVADGLLAMVDAIRDILANLESDGIEGDDDFEPLVAQLKQLLEGGTAPDSGSNDEVAAEQAADDTPVEQAAASESAESENTASEQVAEQVAEQAVDAPTVSDSSEAPSDEATQSGADTEGATQGNVQAESADSPPTPSETKNTASDPSTPTPAPAPPSATTTDAASPPATKAPQTATKADDSSKKTAPKGDRSHGVADSTVRIDVQLLDRLMNLVGELVLARNQILQFCSETDDAAMSAASQRLNLITTELQEDVMKTRMQPIRNAWSKLPRVVRDLSSFCGKRVDVRMEGADTELDKTILEAIKDPLTHIVRNSVDHGIESADVRVANGKPAEGTLMLRAYHEGGQVNIEIADDGGGIRPDKIRDKAIDRGLLTPERAETMSDRELINLILLPGFSTAEKVTNVSGRGVGMDVVKTNIERIGGTLDIQSNPGQGTTLRIKIPLTLAIVPALIVKTCDDYYAIPQVSLLEVVRLEKQRAGEEIEFIHDFPVYRLREQLLPLVYLDEQLGLRPRRTRGDAQQDVNIVVLQAEDRQFGLVVDAVTDTQEIVVKPLAQHLKNISAYAGGTIMGDGTVALILDVIGIAQKSSVLTEHRDKMISDKASIEAQADGISESLLIVDTNEGTRAAIRLSTVSRLEEFEVSKVEKSGQSHVVQYRGEILPLVALNNAYGSITDASGDTLNAVVYSSGEQRIGVVVGRIVDIVHERGNSKTPESRRIIADRVTEVVDLDKIFQQVYPGGADWSAA